MLLFGPYLVETAAWVIVSTLLVIWVTRIYLNSFLALTFGKIRRPSIPARLLNRGKAPLVTVMLPVYNEENVIDRLLRSVTAIDYPNLEIVVTDDNSTDSTPALLRNWQRKSGIKVAHRVSRRGYKAGAVNHAMRFVSPNSRYLLFFDADYQPGPGIVWELLSDFSKGNAAAVQGYTKQSLNATQNFMTKSANVSFSIYSLVDMPCRQRLHGLIPLFGTVFMIDRHVFQKLGGFDETSITEDWNMSLKLAINGYRVIFDENISAAGECPSSVRSLIRQQMRWAEGIVRDTRRAFLSMLLGRKPNMMQKFDFLYYGLGPFMSLVGMTFYVLNTIAFLIQLRVLIILGVDNNLILQLGPYGHFLIYAVPVYVPLAFVLATLVALYREDKLRLLPWCAYMLAVNTFLSPFIAYASIRGLFLSQGSWSRTQKSGRISG